MPFIKLVGQYWALSEKPFPAHSSKAGKYVRLTKADRKAFGVAKPPRKRASTRGSRRPADGVYFDLKQTCASLRSFAWRFGEDRKVARETEARLKEVARLKYAAWLKSQQERR